jgi:hypothetical protein
MVPRSLFNSSLQAFQNELKVRDEDRPKIRRWLEDWLVKVSTDSPGKWAEQFRPRLVSLSKSIDLEWDRSKSRFRVVCSPVDSETLAYLTRGTMWFDGIDRIEAEVVRVISTSNLTPES